MEERDSENGPSVELALVWQVGFERLCLAKPGSVRLSVSIQCAHYSEFLSLPSFNMEMPKVPSFKNILREALLTVKA